MQLPTIIGLQTSVKYLQIRKETPIFNMLFLLDQILHDKKRESKGEQSNLNNYRPISLPGMFLKSFKKIIIAILEATSGAASAPR